jgi:[acyl-carrier-protein] S-malonyltransferase
VVTLLFPGQGSQSVGMGKALVDVFPVARRTFEEADAALGFSLSSKCFEGPEEDLKRTELTQPAILTTSIAAHRVLLERRPDLKVNFAAGHSLGEWSALVAVGALAFADAVRLVRERGRLMQEAVPLGQGAMAAVLGLLPDEVKAVCEKVGAEMGQVVVAANFNSTEQTVISGSAAGVEAAGRALTERGAKKIAPLPVSAPFHSPLMAPAARGLAVALDGIAVSTPNAKVVTNVEAQPNGDASRIKALLVEQVTAPVRWVETVQFLVGAGETTAIEIGPGKVLMGLARRIDRNLKVLNVEDVDSLEKTLAVLGS